MQANKYVVIVCAYSSGNQLAKHFLDARYNCIHITTRELWNIDRLRKGFHANDFCENLIIDNELDLADVLAYLKKHDIHCIIAGSESGVVLADKIITHFNVPQNDPQKSAARRNKFEMIKTVQNAELLAPEQFKTNSKQEAINWFNANNYEIIILKPPASTASDSVFCCHSASEVAEAFDCIFNKKNMYNQTNEYVLLQEYIPGDEYIVNSISFNKKHLIIDIWKGYSQTPHLVSTDCYADLVHSTATEYNPIVNYVKKVLDALGIENGPAHSEVRLSPKGPCIIEVGARLPGKTDFQIIKQALGTNQLELTIESLLEPQKFLDKTNKYLYPTRFMRYVYFASSIEGQINKQVDLTDMLNLNTVASVKLLLDKGRYLHKTDKIRRKNRPGYAYQMAENQQDIENDYVLLKQYEVELYQNIIE